MDRLKLFILGLIIFFIGVTNNFLWGYIGGDSYPAVDLFINLSGFCILLGGAWMMYYAKNY